MRLLAWIIWMSVSVSALRPPLVRQMGRRDLLAGTSLVVASPAAFAADADNVYRPAPGSLKGRTVLVTGANTGLGLETAIRLAAAGATVYGTARTAEKAASMEETVRERVPKAEVKGLLLDLASLDSIRSFKVPEKIDVLVNNAGVMALPDKRYTQDGFERQVGVNFLGHFALTAVLLPFMKETFRVVNVSSSANYGADRKAVEDSLDHDLDSPQYSQWGNYCESKAYNILFTNELQRRFENKGLQASAVSLHPGAVATDLGRYLIGGSDAVSSPPPPSSPFAHLILKTLSFVVLPIDQGANTQVFLAADPDLASNGGKYFDKMAPANPNSITLDREIAGRLWDLAEKLTDADYASL